MPTIAEEIILTKEESANMLEIIEKEKISVHKFINRAVRMYIKIKSEV